MKFFRYGIATQKFIIYFGRYGLGAIGPFPNDAGEWTGTVFSSRVKCGLFMVAKKNPTHCGCGEV
ncbi:MAG: hypothetical protein M0Q91_12490 [Methanoregula sp.]|jgi:hypothetical protein|nr:hypothetical protein [Methanoregula sp.]